MNQDVVGIAYWAEREKRIIGSLLDPKEPLATRTSWPPGTLKECFTEVTLWERGAVLDNASNTQHVSAEASLICGNPAIWREPRVNNKGQRGHLANRRASICSAFPLMRHDNLLTAYRPASAAARSAGRGMPKSGRRTRLRLLVESLRRNVRAVRP